MSDDSRALQFGVLEQIASLLQQSPSPLSWKSIERHAKLRGPELEAALTAAIQAGAAYRWPDYRGSRRYWCNDPDQVAREAILSAAAACAVTSPELARLAATKLPGYPRKLITAGITQLIRESQLRKYPPFGRGGPLLARAGVHAAFVAASRKAIAEIEKRVAATAPHQPSADLQDAILAAMNQLEPGRAPVSIRDLRKMLPLVPKPDFDRAALALHKAQQVFLNWHDYPQSLTDADRDLLIDGGDGSYYVAITAR